MREISPIKIANTPEAKAFWEHIKKTSKEVDKWPEWMKPKYPAPVPRYDLGSDKLICKQRGLRTRITSLRAKHKALTSKASEIWKKSDELLKRLQNKCPHQYCLERKTSWRDEYDSWHDGYPERKCVDCFLKENSDWKGYQKLDKSTVIELVTHQGEKIFSLEFEDLEL
jgi:hypothetical protein